MTPALQAVRALNNAKLARILAGAPSLTEEEQAEIVEREFHAEFQASAVVAWLEREANEATVYPAGITIQTKGNQLFHNPPNLRALYRAILADKRDFTL